MKRIVVCTLLLSLLLSGCRTSTDTQASEKASRALESMDTVMTLTAYGRKRNDALTAAETEIRRLDALLSTGQANSEVSLVNAAGSLTLSDDTAAIVSQAMTLYEASGGLFDITIYPLTKLWGFPTKEYHVPTEAELNAVLPKVNGSLLRLDGNTLTLGAGQEIDLGGIGKGYTSQRIMTLWKEMGVASGLVSLGGNIQCLGSKPDGSPWNIGITDPWNKDSGIYAVVQVIDEAVITSGGYERNFTDEATGITYRHILDPRTGYPADSGIASVSIITPDGTLGDGLSTTLYILGLEGAADYWRSHSADFQAILILEDGTLYATEGLTGRMTSNYEIHVITRQSPAEASRTSAAFVSP